MSDTVRLRLEGTVAQSVGLQQRLEALGYSVASPGMGGPDATQIINTVITVTGHPAVWGPLVLVVHKFRQRHPKATVATDDIDELEELPKEGSAE
jgi:hypothetical protein